MSTIFQFLYKHLHWLVFIVLEIICFVLLFSYNSYQGSIYLSTANSVTARLLSGKSRVNSYFALADDNAVLVEQNARLKERVFELEQMLSAQLQDSMANAISSEWISRAGYHVTGAKVVDNSINKTNNFITIDKGTAEGLAPDMGVIGTDGAVGVVYKCSEHYSLVLPLLNSKSNLSCKVLNSDYFGFLRWEGGDARYAILHDMPRYAVVNVGDTIVTSGHSSFFPDGIVVGRVEELHPSADGLYVTLRVALSTDFARLHHAFVLRKMDAAELAALKETLNPKKAKRK